MKTARPVVIDHFLTPDELAACDAAWPAADWPGWIAYDARYEAKRASDLTTPLPPALSCVLARMSALNLAERLGMPDAAPDLSLCGGGLHEMPAGVGLGEHRDADTHPRLGLRRAASAVLWVHRRWPHDWGGAFWVRTPDGVREVAPLPGRLCAFDCREAAHGVRPVRCPEGASRRSLALFFFLPEAGPRLRPRAAFEDARASSR